MIRPVLAILLLSTLASCSHNTKFTIHSGDKTASFFQVASSICNVFNKKYAAQNYQCLALESQGADANLQALLNKKADIAVIKNSKFYKSLQPNLAKEFRKKVNFVANIHSEYLTILVQKNSQIKSLKDLNNKSVNLGITGSSSFFLTQKYLTANNIKPAKINNFGATKSFKMMCENKMDAWVYFIGHPNKNYAAILKNCDVELLQLTTRELKNFRKVAPFLKANRISKNIYPLLDKEINTISSDTILASRSGFDPQIISALQDILQNHKAELIAENPIFSHF